LFSEAEGAWSVARKIRAGAYHIGLALPNSHRSALELWLGRIPQRIGYSGFGRTWFLTHAVERPPGFVPMRKRPVPEIRALVSPPSAPVREPPPTAHHLHHYLHLVSTLGANPQPVAPQIAVSDAEVEAARSKFGIPNDPRLLGLNPGAEYGPAKRWPKDRFIDAAAKIQERAGCCSLILGGSADVQLAGEIAAALAQPAAHNAPTGPINLAGRTSLRELCAVLKLCRCLLTNDSGPMHVAAALGTPVVVPFGSTSPELTGPGLPRDSRHRLLRSRAPCSPCYRRECPIDFRCMHAIEVESVVQAALEVLCR